MRTHLIALFVVIFQAANGLAASNYFNRIRTSALNQSEALDFLTNVNKLNCSEVECVCPKSLTSSKVSAFCVEGKIPLSQRDQLLKQARETLEFDSTRKIANDFQNYLNSKEYLSDNLTTAEEILVLSAKRLYTYRAEYLTLSKLSCDEEVCDCSNFNSRTDLAESGDLIFGCINGKYNASMRKKQMDDLRRKMQFEGIFEVNLAAKAVSECGHHRKQKNSGSK